MKAPAERGLLALLSTSVRLSVRVDCGAGEPSHVRVHAALVSSPQAHAERGLLTLGRALLAAQQPAKALQNVLRCAARPA